MQMTTYIVRDRGWLALTECLQRLNRYSHKWKMTKKTKLSDR